jgi:hypothetical protein
MAKDKRTDAPAKPSKMTVMLFQLEGSDETLQEGFRTINNAIDKLANPVVRVLPPSAAKALASAKNGDETEQEVLEAEYTDTADEGSTVPPPQEKSRERSGASWTPAQPKILDLDLKAGSIPLREYLEQKKPSTDNRKYLLIAAWMKNNLSLDEIGIHHIYTAYRHMGWTSQKDVGSPLRSMKSQNSWFNKGKEKGMYAINHIGLDQADRNSGE